MPSRRTALPFLMLLAVPAALPADDIVPASVAGVARVDITPKYPVRLSGYGSRRAESEGVAQPIWAKALAVGEGAETLVILTVDNLGVPEEISAEVARRVKVPRERLAVCSSHTHSAPMLTNVAPTLFGVPIPPEHQKHIDQYTRELTDNLEKAARGALDDRKPAHLAWAKGKVGFAANRRTAGGPVDHDLPVLRVTDQEGKLRALLVNYACHCTTLGGEFNKIHGDWSGCAQELLERANPGAIALIAIGCGADANPSPRGNVKLAEQHGEAITREVARLRKGQWQTLPRKVEVRFDRLELPFDTLPTRAEWEARAKQGGAIGYHAQVQLKKLNAGQQIPTKLPYSVQTWSFGKTLTMVFLPGEVVVDYALRLKKEYDPERTWVNAYANDDPCYIPSVRILREGGYEGGGAMIYYDRPTRFAPQVEQLIFDIIQRQIPAVFKAPKDPKEFPPPKSPKDSLACIKLKPGFRAELVAAEPLVRSPVAIDWGPDGKLWVVEMYDYPTGLDGNFKPGGRVKYLEDTDGDGVYDKATILADGLPFPTGVMAWKKGVLVCAAPDVIYFEDTKGTGKADVRKVILTGFDTSNYQARINGLSLGLDGWVYAANGLLGGKVVSPLHPQKVIDLGGRDLRFKPDTGEIEPAAGLSQQGRVRDDWGNWFGNDNSNLLWHYPLPEHYLRRNPHFIAPPARSPIMNGGDPDPNKLFPASRILKRFNDFAYAGRTTSACGPTIYRDNLLGQEYYGNAFICEPVHNLVTRRVLTPRGSTFVARRAADEQDREFLSSTDNWFRPVQARTGPDGALWVVDMYRFVIEHPRWITPDRLAELDVRAGADSGRIYRVVPVNAKPRRVPRLDKMTTAELVEQLNGPNGVVRDLAQQTLVELSDVQSVPILERLAHEGTPFGRLHALCTLQGFRKLRLEVVWRRLGDMDPGVRRHAIRLAEPFLGTSTDFNQAFSMMFRDKDAAVRFQTACSLGDYKPSNREPPTAGAMTAPMRFDAFALYEIIVRDTADPFTVAAVFSSLNASNLGFFAAQLRYAGTEPDVTNLTRVLAMAPAIAQPKDVWHFVTFAAIPSGDPTGNHYLSWQFAATASFLDGIERLSLPPPGPGVRDVLEKITSAARERVLSDKAAESDRIGSLQLLGRATDVRDRDIATIGKLVSPQQPLGIQQAALARLAQINHASVSAALLADWRSKSPDIQGRALDALLSRDAWLPALLDALEKGAVRPADLDANRRQRLVAHKSATIRERAAKALQSSLDPDRRKVVESYKSVAGLSGNAKKGAEVFAKTCAACHKVGDVGHNTGPDLAALSDRSTDALLIAILDPNRALDARYASFNVTTKRGQQFSGMLRSETAASITLVGPDNKRQEILRSEIEEMTNSGKSLMPDGLEKDIAAPAMGDLIAYLQGLGLPPKSVAGNKPVTVKPRADGILHLRAADCEIHGGEITFEPEFGNLGMWHGENDLAAWTVEVPKTGRYRVEMTYACDNSSAGNVLVVQSGDAKLTMRVAGTGRWADYKSVSLGDMELGAGPKRITARPGGPLRGALIDLKEIRIVPK